MKRTPSNLVFHELIGLRVDVVSHSDPSLVGLKGVVVWEIRNMLFIKNSRGKIVKVLKQYGTFRFYLPSGVAVEVSGTSILGRPDERLKRARDRFRW
ncbi:MAG: ribonuclease P protein subunit [Thermoprotei archaeon]|nr:MAG: ribonuclease P protein subunit [Thermoprotei archaeon]